MSLLNNVLLIITISLNIDGCLYAQTISTVAGIGVAGDSGDGEQATISELNVPAGIVFDKFGNLIFSDAGNNCIREINTAGVIETIAGNGVAGYSGDGGPATNAMLNDPNGLAIDTSGNIYIADIFNLRIRIVYKSGIINTFAGNGLSGLSGDGGQATAARIDNPGDIAVDKFGNVFFSGINIRKINLLRVITTVAGNGGFGFSGDGGPATDATLHSPIGLSVDESGNIYFADNENSRIRKVSEGIISTIAGCNSTGYIGDGGPATNAFLTAPYDAKVDKFGNVFITDYGNNVVREITPTGYISTIAGNNLQGFSGDGGPAKLAELNGPYFVCLDNCDNIYISDGHNNRIRKVTYATCNYLNVINVNEEKPLSIHPNPVYDNLNIDNIKSASTYFLVNLVGKEIQQGTLHEDDNSIDIHAIANGMYLLEITDEEGKKTIRKIVKQ